MIELLNNEKHSNEITYFEDSDIATLNDDNQDKQNNIYYWANRYFHLFILNSSIHTQRAKKNDFDKFLTYFVQTLHTSNIEMWAPSVTRGFQNYLKQQKSTQTAKSYAATSVNRIIATIRHFGLWINKERPLPAGNPFNNVKDIIVDEPAWNGLSTTEITRLKAACDVRLSICKRTNQNPLLEASIFYVLLNTGMREMELVSLNYGQYYARGFHNIKRKGNKVTQKVSLPSEAKAILDTYLEMRQNKGDELHEDTPIFVSRYGNRISTKDVARVCERIANQASAQASEPIKLTPHMLRHTFLKRVADKHGVHFAQELSGNVSIRTIFRYTKPSSDDKAKAIEELF